MDNYFTMANVWGLVWLGLGLLLSIGATMLAATALFPSLAERCSKPLERPGSAFLAILLGAACAVGAVVLVAVFSRVPKIGPPAAMFVGSCAGVAALCGASGLVLRMARRFSQGGDPGWSALLRSATVLSLSFLLPIAGWVLVLPLSLLYGLGSAVMAVFRNPTPVPGTLPPPVPAQTMAGSGQSNVAA